MVMMIIIIIIIIIMIIIIIIIMIIMIKIIIIIIIITVMMMKFCSITSWNASKSAIHSKAKSHATTSILLKMHTKGSWDLYRTEQAYSMLLMKVVGLTHRGVSITYNIIVGKEEESNLTFSFKKTHTHTK